MKPIDILGLKNFRIFDDQNGFWEELSSINILTGANNSGKSSVVKALQLLKNSVKESKYPFDLDLINQEHLLGDFDNLLNNKDNRKVEITLPFLFMGMKRIYIKLLFEAPDSQNTYKAKLRGIDVGDKDDKITIFSFFYRDATQEEKDQYEIDFPKELEEYNRQKREATASETDIFNNNYYWMFPPTENPLSGYIEWKINVGKLKEYFGGLLQFYEIYEERKKEWNADAFKWVDERAKDLDIIPSSVVRSFKKDADMAKWKDFVENKMGNQNVISGREHIGDRDFDAEDFYFPRPEIENILYSKVSDILKDNLKWIETDNEKSPYNVIDHCFSSSWDNLIQRINTINYLSNIKEENARSYDAGSDSPFINLLKSYQTTDFLDTDFVRKYLEKFKIGKKISLTFNPKYQSLLVSITTLDGQERELVDFGYGIKQIILILIQISVLALRNKSLEHRYDDYDGSEYLEDKYDLSLLLIEEPESNLHPKWQSLLADMFVEANQEFNIQLLIETHSEYLIRKFQTIVAEKEIEGKNVRMFYLRALNKDEKDKKQVESFFIQDDGSIDYNLFDKGFFDENYNLNLSLLNIQRDKFFKDFEDLKAANRDNEATIEDLKNAALEDQAKIQEGEAKIQEGEARNQANEAKITESETKLLANQQKIEGLEQRIDAFVNKADVAGYRQFIEARFPDHAKLDRLSVDYLVAGQYLLANIEPNGDYSPVILQYGRAVENELKRIFLLLDPAGTWLFGKMQGSLEKLRTGASTFPSCNATQLAQLPIELSNMFNNYANLRYDLINDIRDIRNEASHAGHKKTRQQALDYITMVNDFLDKWISEMK